MFETTSTKQHYSRSLSLPYSVLMNSNDICIHEKTLEGIWDKATALLNGVDLISKVPGCTSKYARMVASKSGTVPHFVTTQKQFTGQFMCDSQCEMFTAYKICAHTIATAEVNGKLSDFLTWFLKTLRRGNLTKLAGIDMPSKSGKKKGSKLYSKKKKTMAENPIVMRHRIQLPSVESPIYTIGQPSRITSTVASTNTHSFSPGIAVTDSSTPCISPVSTFQPVVTLNQMPPSVSNYCSHVNIDHNSVVGTVNSHAPASSQQFTDVTSPYPFTLKFLNSRVQKCQGCKLLFRQPGVEIKSYDLIVSRLERRQFRSPSGELTTPWKPSNAHYHLHLECIRAADSSFIPSMINIPGSVSAEAHKSLLFCKLGLLV